MALDQTAVQNIVAEVLRQIGQLPEAAAKGGDSSCGCHSKKGKLGVFETATDAANAAQDAFEQLKKLGVEGRTKVVEIVKTLCMQNAEEWGSYELEETKIGRLDHKIEKLQIINKVPGVEWLRPDAMSGDAGIMLEEYAPFGVVGAILPVTHSVPTLSGNVVNMVAAGNAVVFNPHPGGARSAALAVRAYNEAIERESGISNLICTVENPTIDSFNDLCKADPIGILAITGGPGVVNAAMKSGKRSICAGPGNPPVIVDETANLDKAARDIIAGAAYDNNLLCIGEKAVFVVESVFNQFMNAMAAAGAQQLTASQVERLAGEAFTYKEDGGGCSHPVLNRDLVGADASRLAELAGANPQAGAELLFAETAADHAFVVEEQMMPMLPIVKTRNFEEALAGAKAAEHGYKHSSIIHSLNVDHMTEMAKEMDTTIFVKNGPCVSGLGLGGEGYLSYSIATTTGEGITTPKTFTRVRRCVMVENLRIV